jgi:hypothetical protein
MRSNMKRLKTLRRNRINTVMGRAVVNAVYEMAHRIRFVTGEGQCRHRVTATPLRGGVAGDNRRFSGSIGTLEND